MVYFKVDSASTSASTTERLINSPKANYYRKEQVLNQTELKKEKLTEKKTIYCPAIFHIANATFPMQHI